MSEGFAMELCGNKAAWRIVPEGITSINLENVGRLIQEAGYEVGIQNRLCWTFSGPCDLTLYPSGTLLVKSEDRELAAAVAEQHVSTWAHGKRGESMGIIPDETQAILRSNGIVAYPTSTLPGLATLPTSEALDALFSLKRRQADQPVSLGVASLQQAELLVHVPEFAHRLLADFERGSLTLILDAHTTLDPRLGGQRVAVRVFAHPIALALAQSVGPVTATSANIAGTPPLSETETAGLELGLTPHAILSGNCPGGQGSTLVSIEQSEVSPTGYSVSIMREGVIPQSDVTSWMLKNH